MGKRAPLIMSGLMLLGMAALNAWAWRVLPGGMAIAIHFDLAGHANGFAHKPGALLPMPLLGLAFTAVFAALTHFRGRAGSANTNLYVAAWMGVLTMLCVADIGIVMRARSVVFDSAGSVLLVIALLITALGNFLGKTTPNPWAGVRTKWTYASDYS